jgi:hypothetical protein
MTREWHCYEEEISRINLWRSQHRGLIWVIRLGIAGTMVALTGTAVIVLGHVLKLAGTWR